MESKINYYSAKRLYENGIEEHGMLVCNKIVSDYALISVNDRENCHLFDQAAKALGTNVDLNKVFIIVDFKDFNNVLNFKPFVNGIKIIIDEEEIVFVDYLKSNSMNKNCCIYYINKKYFEIIDERINFGFNTVDKVPLSKWYAYSGLSLSDCHILNNINLTKEEVCIIDDKKTKMEVDCITAISLPILLNILQEYKEKIENFKTRPEYYRLLDDDTYNVITLSDCNISAIVPLDNEMNCYYNSKDFDNLPADIQQCINDIIELKNIDMEEIIDYIDDKIYDYEQELLENTIEWFKIHVKDFPVEINHFDGEGLVSLEFSKEINQALKDIKGYNDEESEEFEMNYESSNSFQIRLPFLKGVIHSCDFKQFFKEHNVSKIKGFMSYKGRKTYDYYVDKLKLIITKSQFKALTFMKNSSFSVFDYFDLLEKYDYHLGISGLEPANKKHVKLCYQFLSTLPISNEAFDDMIDENIDRLKKDITEEMIIDSLRLSDSKSNPTGLDIYYKYPKFYKSTNTYKSNKTNMFETEKRNLALGKLSIDGKRKYLCGDLLAILYHAISKNFDIRESLDLNSFYAPNTNLLDECIILRNPHYSRNEITIMKNNDTNDERRKYFGHLTGVLMVNPASLTADRLGGADYDGDTVCIINDKKIIDIVKPGILNKDYSHIYPLVKIPSVSYQPSTKDESLYYLRLKSLDGTFSNRTGFISNMAFDETLTVYHGSDSSDVENIGFYTVLGGLEIDSCKNGKKPSLPSRRKMKDEFLKVKDVFLNRHKNRDFNVRDSIININDLFDNNLVYYNFSKIIRETVSKEKDLYKFEKLNSPIDFNYLKCYAIYRAFNQLEYTLETYLDEDKEDSNIQREIIKQINFIFNKNNIKADAYELVKKFKINAYTNFNKYLDKNITPYHYLTDNESKIRFIKEVLLINNLTEEELKSLITFNNEGFKVLYLSLYYNYLSDDRAKLISLLNIKQKFDLETSEDYLLFMNKYYNQYIDYITDLINEEKEYKNIKVLVINYLKEEAKLIPYITVFSVINPLTSRLVFSVFKSQLLEFLAKEDK